MLIQLLEDVSGTYEKGMWECNDSPQSILL